MDLQQLRYFAVVAEELHFTRAARRLYVDQSALSAAVRRLERDLGTSLFVRTTRHVELTEAGRVLLPEARSLLAAAEEFQLAVERARGGPQPERRHRVVVGLYCGSMAAAELTGPIVHAFHTRHPELALEVRPLTLFDPWGAADPDLDVVVTRDGGLPGDEVTVLFHTPRLLAVPAQLDLAGVEEVHLADVADLTWTGTGGWPPSAQEFMAGYDLRAEGLDVRRAQAPALPIDEAWRWHAEHEVLVMTNDLTVRRSPPGVVLRPLAGRPTVPVTVLDRRGDSRTRAFVAVAAEVSAALRDLVPDALPPQAQPA
ncbi:LysR substrate binding domain-containing protein [Kineococcus xinjiangensis]|uniref:LysR substrate binding domain-containing protein n=1 Tax=Kineococcus xinjiangensis TaxID=512762 RepID=A0A2S6IG20_9ACTN|nr:LysR substrate binding domain-containing protein [Kineococcus xinjiangensis]